MTEIEQEHPSDDMELVLRVVPLPRDNNVNGDIFGGWVMSHVDIAGTILPSRLAGGRVATVAVNEMVFKHPVLVGDVVSFYAKIIKQGRTSVQVLVEVFAEPRWEQGKRDKVTQATLTYVSIDESGRPRELRNRLPD